MGRAERYDVVIIGAGHNGTTTAAPIGDRGAADAAWIGFLSTGLWAMSCEVVVHDLAEPVARWMATLRQ